MDQKKTLTLGGRLLAMMALPLIISLFTCHYARGQQVGEVVFCDRSYDYREGSDSITLMLRVLDADGKRLNHLATNDLTRLQVLENGIAIDPACRTLSPIVSGARIPDDYTFSVVVDQNIERNGKNLIRKTIQQLIETAPDSSVYISFFGDEVGQSRMATPQNFRDFNRDFMGSAQQKFFYTAIYAKLIELIGQDAPDFGRYDAHPDLLQRASRPGAHNIVFLFTEAQVLPSPEEEVDYFMINDLLGNTDLSLPKVYAFYYTADGSINENVKLILEAVTSPRLADGRYDLKRSNYHPSTDMESIRRKFEADIDELKYNYELRYRATPQHVYRGRVDYNALWDGSSVGSGALNIGTEENPWPVLQPDAGDWLEKLLWALLIAALTIIAFIIVTKIIIPALKSKAFAARYYKRYAPQPNERRVCFYCKQPLEAGQMVVTKCEHIMHVECWKHNDYHCAEYGQNCATGMQEHVHTDELFTKATLRDCHQTISGVVAGMVSWLLYELMGRGIFGRLAQATAQLFFTGEENVGLQHDCATKVESMLLIGLLLGFFLSLVFRYNDEYRNRNWQVWLRIVGLSLFTSLVGMLSFALGGAILCVLVSGLHLADMPWYCSLPAYLLFSLCTSVSLTVRSSIPVKSALLGGLCSAVIGFLVLYLSYGDWMPMLLNFIIYGGGLGASLVVVRSLAESYYLIIENGVRSGVFIPIHKWMSATGGGQHVMLGMAASCEIQMNWEKSNKVAKEHAELYIDHDRNLPMMKPLAQHVVYNNQAELPVNKAAVLQNGDTFQIGDTRFRYIEADIAGVKSFIANHIKKQQQKPKNV